MTRLLVMVGTRKGCFLLDGDAGRDRFVLRGPFCDGWPIYDVAYEPESGTILAAAASEWHGAGVWRSRDLGSTWEFSGDGLAHGADGLRLSKLSGITAAHGRVLAGGEAAGLFESRDAGATWSLVSTLDGQPGREDWNDPAKQPPGHLGLAGLLPHPDDPERLWAVVQGYGAFETTDAGATWAPRNRGLRTAWPIEEDAEVGFCVHKLVMAADRQRLYQQNHCGMHRSDDAGRTWHEITEGLPADFGFAAAAHPHDRDGFYVVPLDPGHARCAPEGRLAVWRTRDGGGSWERLDRGLPGPHAYLGVLREGMAIDDLDDPGLYVGTSTGQLYASADAGDTWRELAGHLPGIASVEVARVA